MARFYKHQPSVGAFSILKVLIGPWEDENIKVREVLSEIPASPGFCGLVKVLDNPLLWPGQRADIPLASPNREGQTGADRRLRRDLSAAIYTSM